MLSSLGFQPAPEAAHEVSPFSLARPLRHGVGIGHAWGDSSVPSSHRSHVARSITGDASAGSQSKLRWAIAAGEAGRRGRTLRLNGEEFARRVPRDADDHPGHVIGYVERLLVLTSLERTIAGGLRLVGGGARVETSAVGGGRSRVFDELFLERIRGLGSRGRRARRARLVAGCETEQCDGEKDRGSSHVREIVNAGCGSYRERQPFLARNSGFWGDSDSPETIFLIERGLRANRLTSSDTCRDRPAGLRGTGSMAPH